MSERDYLAEILVDKRREVARRLRHRAAGSGDIPPLPPSALEALRRPSPGDPCRIIAEVKFRSPSAGVLRTHTAGEGVTVARAYAGAGAAAISVLADRRHFDGSALEVRRVASNVSVPVLFKEFVLHEVQVELARQLGAAMVLLLVRALPPARLAMLVARCRTLGLEAVVEAADLGELEVAVDSGARILGVNARDLRTFRVDPDLAARAMERIPPDRIAVFMSGVRNREDVVRVEATRADAILVGESLMRAENPGAKLRDLRGTT